MHNYRELRVWNAAVLIARRTYSLTDGFPPEERFGLVRQMRRAAVSIGSNIAEGSSRHTARDFRRFIETAQGSAFELDTQLAIASDQGYGPPDDFDALSADIQSLSRMLTNLRKVVMNQRDESG